MTTDKQKRAVAFCGQWCREKYDGDLENFKAVSEYLSRNLKDAKRRANETIQPYIHPDNRGSYARAAFRDSYWENGSDDWYLDDAFRNDFFG